METIYKICIPNTHRDAFDYQATLCDPCIGARVWVPFRHQTRLGIVIEKIDVETLKTPLKLILQLIDHEPLLSPDMLELCRWVGRYYQAPLSEILPLALPKKYRQGLQNLLPKIDYFELALSAEEARRLITPRASKQQALIDFLGHKNTAIPKKTLQEEGFKLSHLNALLAAGILIHSEKTIAPDCNNQQQESPLCLNKDQDLAVSTIMKQLNSYHCFLIQGITGSGKTEVYLQIIAEVLQKGLQVLVLVPEIGLTPQLLARFKNRFKEPIAVIHSHLNESERQIAWQWANDALVRLVIGTRTAIFTPMPLLGLIVIDEEHDASLKQMDKVRYSARDTALMRAHRANIPIILGSATPSLESLHNCIQTKYTRLRLNQKALTHTPLHYQLVDIRGLPMQDGLADSSLTQIKKHLQQGNQVLVFINRRGYAPVFLCHQCGWIADCTACDSHLTLHRQLERLLCHHCGAMNKIPTQCPHCHSKELLPVGVGTQRIYDYLSHQFPQINVLRIDRDKTQKKHTLEKYLEQIHTGEAQLIVGTQMLAKGHHFPKLTLVVVLEADAGFYNTDFRAIEHLGQLLTQVAGRAGRAEQAGQVIIQTHLPDHPLLNVLIQQGYDAFAEALLIERQHAHLPPYHYLAVIRAQDKEQNKVLHFLHHIKQQLLTEAIQALGPAPSPLARKAHLHQMQLLIKSSSRTKLQRSLTRLREWLATNKLSQNIRWNIDVDPMDLS